MRRVILESPLKGERELNRHYARLCARDCLMRGEAPFASHLLYDQSDLLDDDKPEERKLGMDAGFEWHSVAEACVVYTDRDISDGMKAGIARAEAAGLPIEYRSPEGYEEPDQDSLLRQQRLARIGSLSMDHGILTILLSPYKDIMFQSDGLAMFEVLGMLRFVEVRVERSIALMVEEEILKPQEPAESTVM